MYQIVSHTPTIATFSMYFLAMIDFEPLQEMRDQETYWRFEHTSILENFVSFLYEGPPGEKRLKSVVLTPSRIHAGSKEIKRTPGEK